MGNGIGLNSLRPTEDRAEGRLLLRSVVFQPGTGHWKEGSGLGWAPSIHKDFFDRFGNLFIRENDPISHIYEWQKYVDL